MGHEIPVFFMPIEQSDAPNVVSWSSAEAFIGKAYESRTESGLRMSTSRNWWHLENAKRLARLHGSEALNFVDARIACLETTQIVEAIRVLAELLAESSRGAINRVATGCTAEANDSFLHLDLETIDPDATSEQAFVVAYRKATPKNDVEVTSDAGFGAVVDFFNFLKSLFAALVDALLQGKSFLYVRPSQ